MHPVKAEEAIAEAYFEHGVRTFSLDTLEELDKIVAPPPPTASPRATSTCWSACGSAPSMPSSASPPSSAPSRRAEGACCSPPARRRRARHLLPRRQPGDDPGGLCRSDGRVRDAIVEAAVTVDIVDVGGGFPSSYPGMEPPPLETYFAVIHEAFEKLPISYSAELWCEPGRALVRGICACSCASRSAAATSCTSTTAPMARCSTPRTSAGAIPVRLLRDEESHVRPMEFSFYGPTCDDLDHMAGPFELPGDVGPATISRSACSAPMAARCGPVQRLRRRPAPRSSTTSRWRASTAKPRAGPRSNVVKL
jgi:ornithine decarboxylase